MQKLETTSVLTWKFPTSKVDEMQYVLLIKCIEREKMHCEVPLRTLMTLSCK